MIVQYVDDCGISTVSQKVTDNFVNKLQQLELKLTQESTFAEFLGIKFNDTPKKYNEERYDQLATS